MCGARRELPVCILTITLRCGSFRIGEIHQNIDVHVTHALYLAIEKTHTYIDDSMDLSVRAHFAHYVGSISVGLLNLLKYYDKLLSVTQSENVKRQHLPYCGRSHFGRTD